MAVPSNSLAVSPTMDPLPSEKPQRPSRWFLTPLIAMSLVAWISAALRAMFQMRTSSMVPAKNPPVFAGAPVEFRDEPIAACWVLVASGVGLPVRTSVLSSVPSRYRRHVSVAVS
jgi:hypothetical protein